MLPTSIEHTISFQLQNKKNKIKITKKLQCSLWKSYFYVAWNIARGRLRASQNPKRKMRAEQANSFAFSIRAAVPSPASFALGNLIARDPREYSRLLYISYHIYLHSYINLYLFASIVGERTHTATLAIRLQPGFSLPFYNNKRTKKIPKWFGHFFPSFYMRIHYMVLVEKKNLILIV